VGLTEASLESSFLVVGEVALLLDKLQSDYEFQLFVQLFLQLELNCKNYFLFWANRSYPNPDHRYLGAYTISL